MHWRAVLIVGHDPLCKRSPPISVANMLDTTTADERLDDPTPQPRVALALGALDSAAREARIDRALEKAITRLEREQDEKMALWDELERYCLYQLALLWHEIEEAGAQIGRFRRLV